MTRALCVLWYFEVFKYYFKDLDIETKRHLEFTNEEPEVIAYRYIEDMTEKHRGYKKVSMSFKKSLN